MNTEDQTNHAIELLKGKDPRCVAFLNAVANGSVPTKIQAGFDEYCETLTDDKIQSAAATLVYDEDELASILRNHLEFIDRQISSNTKHDDNQRATIGHALFIVQNVIQAVKSEFVTASEFIIELQPCFDWHFQKSTDITAASKSSRVVARKLKRHGFEPYVASFLLVRRR